MTREEALALVKQHVSNPNLVKHMLATEAMMQALANHFGEDQETWGLAGLLHDIDYEATKDDFPKHGEVGSQMLAERGVDPMVVYAVKAHNEALGVPRVNLLDKALFAIEGLSGLITAAVLVHPTKKLSALDVPYVMNRFREKSFARSVNRDHVRQCTEFGLELEEFVGIGLKAMQDIADELGF
jgi:hypothetical protein